MSLYSKEQYKLNPQKFRERHKIYELNNIEKIRLRKKLFRANPLNKLKRKNYRRGRSKIDKNYVIKERLRKRMWAALKGKLKCDKTINLLGCNMSQLHSYLESKFQTGMNWNNYGANGWHIDHIIPCSSFNLLEPSEQKKCFHYTNLQPLWWRDNIVKRDKL